MKGVGIEPVNGLLYIPAIAARPSTGWIFYLGLLRLVKKIVNQNDPCTY